MDVARVELLSLELEDCVLSLLVFVRNLRELVTVIVNNLVFTTRCFMAIAVKYIVISYGEKELELIFISCKPGVIKPQAKHLVISDEIIRLIQETCKDCTCQVERNGKLSEMDLLIDTSISDEHITSIFRGSFYVS